MGHGIAQVFAAKGHEVVLTDVNGTILEQALVNIEDNLAFLSQNGIGASEDIANILKSIRITTSLEKAVTGARFVVEAVSEKLEVKQRLFQDIESYCSPHAILASNTSVISITEIASALSRKERLVGAHFWNPPYLIPLVEVVSSAYTSNEVVEYVFDLMKTAGKHPVRVKKDVPGFVGNRLQHALWREAISIVDQGIADAATVDEVIKNSFGLRLPVLAPLENADMVGLDLTYQIHDYILHHINRSTRPAKVLKTRVGHGDVGFKSGKGFYAWDHESSKALKERLMAHLVSWAKEHPSE
jgi:3-hydroxybutyryl-CoA dehydrogenase